VSALRDRAVSAVEAAIKDRKPCGWAVDAVDAILAAAVEEAER
jgi:hypothetical protein